MQEHQLVVVLEGPEAEQEYLLPTLPMNHYPSSAVEMAVPEPTRQPQEQTGGEYWGMHIRGVWIHGSVKRHPSDSLQMDSQASSAKQVLKDQCYPTAWGSLGTAMRRQPGSRTADRESVNSVGQAPGHQQEPKLFVGKPLRQTPCCCQSHLVAPCLPSQV